MNIDFWLHRAIASAAQRQKVMNRNRHGDELVENNKYFGCELFVDKGCSYRIIIFNGISRSVGTGSEFTAHAVGGGARAPMKLVFLRGNLKFMVRTIFIFLYIKKLNKHSHL